MKKKISLLLFICLIVLTLTGCRTKEISVDTFKETMTKMEYEVEEVEEGTDVLDKGYVARDKENNYEIYFYKFKSNKDARRVFNSAKNYFEEDIKGSYVRTIIGMVVFDKYSLKSDGKYQVVTKVGKTVLYVDADNKYEKDINEVLDKLDY